MSNAIETRDVHCRLGKAFQISDLTLNVPTGAIYGFLGPNGSGKTTTIQLLLALRRAKSGSISVLGRSVPKDIVEVLARTGYVPERTHLDPSLTVGEAMRFHASFHKTWEENRAVQLLAQFDLDRDRKIRRLSKGETGKLLMLLVLAQSPELLVLDEPTEGMDPVVRRDVMTSVLEYTASRNATVFISSHLVHEVERMCDWVGVMDRGTLVAEMPTESFKNGIKRLRVVGAPGELDSPPFTVLSRTPGDGVKDVEALVVRGWQPQMTEYFSELGATVQEVGDLDLEDGFVELLKMFRNRSS
jgi:ABC-2 type transport system ATP-binding protein